MRGKKQTEKCHLVESGFGLSHASLAVLPSLLLLQHGKRMVEEPSYDSAMVAILPTDATQGYKCDKI